MTTLTTQQIILTSAEKFDFENFTVHAGNSKRSILNGFGSDCEQELSGWIRIIAGFPKEIASEVLSLTDEQLDTPYRDGGWTVRQVVHHCAESLDDEDLKRTYVHPEHGQSIPLDEVIGMYAWHCNHHLAHITVLKRNQNWI